jgi:chromosome segregation ATPase
MILISPLICNALINESHEPELLIASESIKLANSNDFFAFPALKETLANQRQEFAREMSKLKRVAHEIATPSDDFQLLSGQFDELPRRNRIQEKDLKTEIATLKERLRTITQNLESSQRENSELLEENQASKSMTTANESLITGMQSERDALTATMRREICARDQRIDALEKSLENSNIFVPIDSITDPTVSDRQFSQFQRQIRDLTMRVGNQDLTIANLQETLAGAQRDREDLRRQLAAAESALLTAQNDRELLAAHAEKQGQQIRQLKETIVTLKADRDSVSFVRMVSSETRDESAKAIRLEAESELSELKNFVSQLKLESDTKVKEVTQQVSTLRSESDKRDLLISRLLMELENLARFAEVANPIIVGDFSETNYQYIEQLLLDIRAAFTKSRKEITDLRARMTQAQLQHSESLNKQQTEIEEKSEMIRNLRGTMVQAEQKATALQQEISQVMLMHDVSKPANEGSLQMSQLDTHSEMAAPANSEEQTAKLRSLEETVAKLSGKKTAFKLEQARLTAEIRELKETVRTKLTEIDKLKSRLQNAESTRLEFTASIEAIDH